MHNRNRAVAGIFDDLAFCDVDDRRTIAVTMPRHAAPVTPMSVDPAVMLARSRYWPKRRPPVMPSNMFVVSSVRRSRKEVATVLRVDQTLAERKCRMALESIRNGYRREEVASLL